LVQKWQIPTIENAILLVTRSLQIFTILKNLKNLLFFIDGKYSVVDTKHAYEVNEKRKTPFGLGMKEKQIVKYAHTMRIYTKSKKENPLR
jgi:hypothetical protein